MDDEIQIDLRKIILTLFQFRFWIAGFGILLGLAVFLFFFLQPRMYEATAVIALTKPRYLPNFDPRFQTVPPTALNSKVAIDIAKSDEIVNFVFDSWNSPDKEPTQRRDFREKNLIAKAGSDPSVVTLTVRLESPEEAARLANLWAQRVTDRLNTLFSGLDQSQLTFFETQIAVAQQSLRNAENRLVEFENRDTRRSLQKELDTLSLAQQEYLRRKLQIEGLIRDGQVFLQEYADLPDSAILSHSEEIRLLMLKLRQYENLSSSENAIAGIQLQIDTLEGNPIVTVGQFKQNLQRWISSLEAQNQEIDLLLADYPQNLTNLQNQIEALNQERKRLDLERDTAAETYQTLVRKYQEMRISLDESSGDAKIASQAFPPIRPASRGMLIYTLVALLSGLMLAAAFVLMRDWWLRGAASETRE